MAISLAVWAAIALAIYFTGTLIAGLRKRRANLAFARAHGCLPPKVQLAHLVFPFSLLKLFAFKAAADNKRHINHAHDLYGLYGPTRVYSSLFVGGRDVIVTSEPENIKTVLATSFHDFELGNERHEAFSALLGDGIFTTDGKVWEHARALLRPHFTKDQIADLEDLEVHFQHLLAILSAQEGQVVGLHELFLNLTLDSSSAFLVGNSVYSLRNKIPGMDTLVPKAVRDESRRFEEDFDYCQNTLGFRLGIWDYRWLYHPRRLPTAITTIHNYVDRFVEQAIRNRNEKREEGKKYVFLDALVQDTQDPKVIRDQILSAMLAGRDTTATLLSWAFWLLARNPRVWKTLREHILNDIGQKKPTYQQLKDSTYLKWVLNESLRLYPVVPINFRRCNKNTTLPLGGGPDGRSPIFVPENARVIYSVYALHRRKDIYGDDADEFKPERWGTGKARGWEYLPFNGGPRICIGQQMALVTASYILIRLLQNFDRIENTDFDETVRTNLSLTLSPANGTKVRLFRDPNAWN